MQRVKKAIAVLLGLSIVLLIAINLLYLFFPSSGPDEATEHVSTAAKTTSGWISSWLKPVANDPVVELLRTLSPLQQLTGIFILGVAAYGFWKILRSSDGTVAKNVAYALSVIGVVYLLIGFISTSFDGDDASDARSKSSSRAASSADRGSMQQVVKERLLLPPYGKVTLSKKGHCYVDNRFDDVLRNTHRYEVGKELVFSSELKEPFKLVVWFYNTNLGCKAGARKLYNEGKFL